MRFIRFGVGLLLLVSAKALAVDPSCDTSWSKTSAQWTCTGNGRITFSSGTTFLPASSLTLIADNGIEFSNNTIGSGSIAVHLQSGYGAINGAATSQLYGNMTTSSGSITLSGTNVTGNVTTNGTISLTNGTITGDVTSNSNTITTNGTSITGTTTANGNINLTNGVFGGKVTSTSNTITTNNATLQNGAQSQSGISITGGTVNGALVMTARNQVSLTNVTMPTGSISGASSVTVSNSDLGTASSNVNITTDSNDIRIQNGSVVYGNLNAAVNSNGTVYVNGGSLVYGVCLPQTQPANACNASPPASIDHYELSFASPGVTCEAEAITIKACSNSSCSSLYTGSSSVTLAANNGGSLTASTVSLASGSGVTYLRLTSPGASTLSITSASPTASGALVCKNGGSTGSCAVTFNDTGLKFVASDGVAAIPSQIAGQSYTAKVRAIETNANTGACQARVNGNRSVNLGFRCVNPSSCSSGQALTANGTAVNGSSASGSVSYTAVNLSFDSSGTASLPLSYSDVGQLSLLGSLTLAASGNDQAITLTAASSSFVVKPYALQIASVSAGAVSNPATTSGSPGFTAAGTALTVDVTATNAQGNVTPNFGRESSNETVTISLASLVYPANGSLTPNDLVNTGNFIAVSGSPGRFRNSAISYRNVGSITLQAGLTDNDYLGAQDVPNKPQSGTIGRFYPANLLLASSNHSALCGNFSYMGQSGSPLSFTIQAVNSQGAVVSNYQNNTANGTGYSGVASFTLVAEDNAGSVNLGNRWSGVTTPSWLAGQYQYTASNVSFSRGSSVDGPFAQLQAGLKVATEQDNRDFLTSAKTINAATSVNCSANSSCDAVPIGNTVAYRYGRLRLEEAAGDETRSLPVVLKAEYFDGSGFVFNSADLCSSVAPGSLTATGSPTIQVSGSSGTLSNGKNASNSLLLSAPNQPGSWLLKYSAPSHLKYNWDNTVVGDEEPTAQALFGRYRGNDRLIFQREQ